MAGRRRVTIGIIGAGFVANVHVENYGKVHGVDLRVKGVASLRPERGKEFAARHDLPRVYPS
ncbi:MAG: gfo/Idh/MocA family oxidoreductase, partial [Bacillati bacterium ANGP1]